MRQVRTHLTYANVMATIAIFLLLGGGSAVALSGSNTVQSDDLGPGAQVKAADVAADAVASGKVANGSLTAADANTTSLQRRVAGTCPSGKAATSVTQAGGLVCADTGGGVDALYGDGSDGDVTIASNTTLSRDTYHHNLTINPGTTLNPGGFRIFVSGTLTLGDGAKIARDGIDATDSSDGGGPELDSGTLGSAGGGTSNPGLDQQSVVNSLGGAGGSGFEAGTAAPPPAAGGGAQVFRQALSALSGRSLDAALVNGGAGGGGDTGPFPVGGVAGGGGGGVVVVVARAVALGGSAAITANGGAGELDSGGGGGGGGVVVVITATAKPAAMTLSAAGGSASSGGQSGAPGFTAWLD